MKPAGGRWAVVSGGWSDGKIVDAPLQDSIAVPVPVPASAFSPRDITPESSGALQVDLFTLDRVVIDLDEIAVVVFVYRRPYTDLTPLARDVALRRVAQFFATRGGFR